MAIENDRVKIIGGIRGGHTLAFHTSIFIENKDWKNRRGYGR